MEDPTQKLLPAGEAPVRLPRPRGEFVAEGELDLMLYNGTAVLWIDDAELAELVAFHFGARRQQWGKREVGRVQIVISRVQE